MRHKNTWMSLLRPFLDWFFWKYQNLIILMRHLPVRCSIFTSLTEPILKLRYSYDSTTFHVSFLPFRLLCGCFCSPHIAYRILVHQESELAVLFLLLTVPLIILWFVENLYQWCYSQRITYRVVAHRESVPVVLLLLLIVLHFVVFQWDDYSCCCVVACRFLLSFYSSAVIILVIGIHFEY